MSKYWKIHKLIVTKTIKYFNWEIYHAVTLNALELEMDFGIHPVNKQLWIVFLCDFIVQRTNATCIWDIEFEGKEENNNFY
jgi:hypothetical protein